MKARQGARNEAVREVGKKNVLGNRTGNYKEAEMWAAESTLRACRGIWRTEQQQRIGAEKYGEQKAD